MSPMDKLVTALQRAIDSRSTTVAELATRGGCSRQYIYNLLSKKSEPTISLAERLASAIGISIVIGDTPKKSTKISA